MIINENDCCKFEHLTHPKIFDEARKRDYKTIFDHIYTHFTSIYGLTVEDFIKDGIVTKANKIISLSIEEYIYIKNNFGYDDPSEILENSIQRNNLRAFLTNCEIDNSGYRLMEFCTKNLDGNDTRYVSLFIGTNFNPNKDGLCLIYDLAEYVIDQDLENEGLSFNLISKTYIQKTLVLNSFVNPSDAKFVVDYYTLIFKCILYSTNSSIVNNFEYIYINGRPICKILKVDCMEKIWQYARNVIDMIDTDFEYIDICNLVYKELNEM